MCVCVHRVTHQTTHYIHTSFHKPLAQFMGGWIIEDPAVTDDLIAEFNKQKKANKVLKGQVCVCVMRVYVS